MSTTEQLYIQLDNLIDNMTASDIANYLAMNNPKYAEDLADSIESELYVQSVEDTRQSSIDFQ